jgi:hypothetical protein
MNTIYSNKGCRELTLAFITMSSCNNDDSNNCCDGALLMEGTKFKVDAVEATKMTMESFISVAVQFFGCAKKQIAKLMRCDIKVVPGGTPEDVVAVAEYYGFLLVDRSKTK